MKYQRIRRALDRAQHAGHVLTPTEIARLYGPEAVPSPRQVGTSPIERRIVTRQVPANGQGAARRREDRISAALDQAQHAGHKMTPADLKPRPEHPHGTPLARRIREARVRRPEPDRQPPEMPR
jgi:hypothetical protein